MELPKRQQNGWGKRLMQRISLVTGGLLLLLMYLATQWTADRTAPPKHDELPNFVFIMADDLGYGDLGYTGGTAETPNLDAMAAGTHSLRLDRYYSGAPVCSPTRGSVLTGRNPNRYCLWSANAAKNCDDFKCPITMPLPTSEVTVAQLLRERGYETAVFGKWHIGNLRKPESNQKWPVVTPNMHGFKEWWVTERSTPTTDPNCACFQPENCTLGHYSNPPPCTNYHSRDGGLMQPIKGDDSHFLAKLVDEFLYSVTSRKKPFFLYVPFHTVHIRYIASKEYGVRYKGYTSKEIDYFGAITGIDAAVGLIRDSLLEYKVSHNTMVWFTSDNGPRRDSPSRTAGFRGNKGNLYEGGIRVPGIVEWPAMIHSNRVSDYAVMSSDLLPTVCDILNISVPSDRVIDGESILPLIRQERPTRNKTIAWAYEIPDGDFNSTYHAAISGDRYKVYVTYESGSIRSAELYDLISDPFETTDISRKFPRVLHDYKDQLNTWKESVYYSAEQEVGCLRSSV